jgi:ribosomal protein L11 methyltransferase
VIRLAVRCRRELADRVLAELLELVPGGVEEERSMDWAEFAIYGPPGELPAIPDLEAAAGDGLVEVTSTEIPDDWADSWRDFHEPVWIGDRMVVRPSWHDFAGADAGASEPEADRHKGERAGAEQPAGIDVVVDPGQAFGTGAHATTRMCLELLLELADAGGARGSLADLGTGSGVLAIAAAELGWAPVIACDSEPAALEAAAANARANSVDVDLRRLNLRSSPPPAAETVVANLTGPLLTEVAGRIDPTPRRLVCSGLLAAERDRVAGAFRDRGLKLASERTLGDWAALKLRSS